MENHEAAEEQRDLLGWGTPAFETDEDRPAAARGRLVTDDRYPRHFPCEQSLLPKNGHA